MPWRVPFDLPPETIAGQFDLRSHKLVGTRRRTWDHRGETVAISENRVVVFGLNLFGSEACEMHDPPEAIASACKVVTRGCRTNAWIDSAEN